MAPYYIMMRLPGDKHAEFFLMLPMVPSQRENMIAWLAARCDPPDYGKLIVYEFPKEKLVYGPFQIEARINQNTRSRNRSRCGIRWARASSAEIFWSFRSKLDPVCVAAISACPVRPATELKRVIAAYGDRVVMEETLRRSGRAIRRIRSGRPPASARRDLCSGPADERARQALGHYDKALDSLKAGDWAGFGAELDALRPLLEQLSGQPTAH